MPDLTGLGGVGPRATAILRCADYARNRFKRLSRLYMRGRSCVAAAHAYGTKTEFFAENRYVVQDAPLSWRDMEDEGGIPPDLAVKGARGRYDWGELLVTPRPVERMAKSFQLRREWPVSVRRNAAGNLLVDFGREAFGWCEILPPPGATGAVEVVLGELLDDGGRIMVPPNTAVRMERVKCNLDGLRPVRRLCIAPGHEGQGLRMPPEIGMVMPFRYAEIVSAPYEVTTGGVRQVAVQYGYDVADSSFACSDPRLTKIWDFCKYSILATSFLGLYVDGDRERLPYEADAYITQLSAYAAFSDPEPAARTHDHLMSRPTWPTEYKQISVFLAWEDWMRRGRTDLLEKHYAALRDEKTMAKYARPSDGLLLTGGEYLKGGLPGCGDIVDWPPPERDGYEFVPVNTVVNAFYHRTLVLMADIARALGKDFDASEFDARAARVFDSFQKAFFDPARGLYVDGEGARHVSLHANAIPLAFGLVPPERRRAIADYCASRGMACSVYVSRFLLQALADNGREDAMFERLLADDDRSWLGMLKQGATITMESWNPGVKARIDLNHSWGSAALSVISREVLGVRPLAPGWTKVSVTPHLGPLEWAEGVVPTIHGGIKVRAERAKDGSVRVSCAPPPGVEAVVGSSAPVPFRERSVYFATHFRNWYEEASDVEVAQYVEELAEWGLTGIAVWFDMHDFKGIDDPAAQKRLQRLKLIFRTASRLGLKRDLHFLANEAFKDSPPELRADWRPGRNGYRLALNGHYHVELCPSKPGATELLLKWRRQVLEAFKDAPPTSITSFPYDQGGCTCSACAPWGANAYLKLCRRISELSRELFSGVKFNLSTWRFDVFGRLGEWDGLFAKGDEVREWADSVYVDPIDLARTKKRSPGGLPVFAMSEISMGGMLPWGGYGANPTPAKLQREFSLNPKMMGLRPYSEGIYEDMDKVIVLGMLRDPSKTALDMVGDYAARYFGEGARSPVKAAAALLEENMGHGAKGEQGAASRSPYSLQGMDPAKPWAIAHACRKLDPAKAVRALGLLEEAERTMDVLARASWRWRILKLRAELDCALARNAPAAETDPLFAELARIYRVAPRTKAFLVPPSKPLWLKVVSTWHNIGLE